MRILLHACCAPCAVYPVKTLRGEGLDLHGFFYNPFIQPLAEFERRLKTLEEYATGLDLPLIVRHDYDPVAFFRETVYRETGRCLHCYATRLDAAARLAAKGRFDAFTTTLLYSRQQKHDLIATLAQDASRRHGVAFLYRDFRTGWKEGCETARALGMYRQQYCGCIYSEMERFRGGLDPEHARGTPKKKGGPKNADS